VLLGSCRQLNCRLVAAESQQSRWVWSGGRQKFGLVLGFVWLWKCNFVTINVMTERNEQRGDGEVGEVLDATSSVSLDAGSREDCDMEVLTQIFLSRHSVRELDPALAQDDAGLRSFILEHNQILNLRVRLDPYVDKLLELSEKLNTAQKNVAARYQEESDVDKLSEKLRGRFYELQYVHDRGPVAIFGHLYMRNIERFFYNGDGLGVDWFNGSNDISYSLLEEDGTVLKNVIEMIDEGIVLTIGGKTLEIIIPDPIIAHLRHYPNCLKDSGEFFLQNIYDVKVLFDDLDVLLVKLEDFVKCLNEGQNLIQWKARHVSVD